MHNRHLLNGMTGLTFIIPYNRSLVILVIGCLGIIGIDEVQCKVCTYRLMLLGDCKFSSMFKQIKVSYCV